ncbi:MAG: ftsW [Acidimicrobiia bacterium]|nr:ftsW [Acidimicrobiia bacterium]
MSRVLDRSRPGVGKNAAEPGRPKSAQQSARLRHPTARRKPPPAAPVQYWALMALCVVLTLFGLVMVLSASSVDAFHHKQTPWFYFRRQALLSGVGLVTMFAISRVDYRRWRVLVVPLLGLAVLACMFCFVPGVGRTVNGATSWVDFGGPLQGQPSELLKLALLLYSADLLARRADRMGDLHSTLFPVLVVLGLGGGVVLLQKDLGTAIVITAIVIAVLFAAGAPLRPLFLTAIAAGAGGAAMVMSSGNRQARIFGFLHRNDPLGTGYQLNQALIAMASGGFSGKGLGESLIKWGYLPEAHTDFILAVIGEELGLVGVVAVVALFVGIAVFGTRAALRAPDRFGSLLAGGVTAWIMVQASINLGAAVGLLPITGLPLPFISFGPSSLLCLLVASGLLLSVARQSTS